MISPEYFNICLAVILRCFRHFVHQTKLFQPLSFSVPRGILLRRGALFFLVNFGSCGALDLNYREDKLVKLEEEEECDGDKNADEEAGFGAEEAHYLAEAAYLDVVPLTDDVAAVDVVAVVEVVSVTAGNETFVPFSSRTCWILWVFLTFCRRL